MRACVHASVCECVRACVHGCMLYAHIHHRLIEARITSLTSFVQYIFLSSTCLLTRYSFFLRSCQAAGAQGHPTEEGDEAAHAEEEANLQESRTQQEGTTEGALLSGRRREVSV